MHPYLTLPSRRLRIAAMSDPKSSRERPSYPPPKPNKRKPPRKLTQAERQAIAREHKLPDNVEVIPGSATKTGRPAILVRGVGGQFLKGTHASGRPKGTNRMERARSILRRILLVPQMDGSGQSKFEEIVRYLLQTSNRQELRANLAMLLPYVESTSASKLKIELGVSETALAQIWANRQRAQRERDQGKILPAPGNKERALEIDAEIRRQSSILDGAIRSAFTELSEPSTDNVHRPDTSHESSTEDSPIIDTRIVRSTPDRAEVKPEVEETDRQTGRAESERQYNRDGAEEVATADSAPNAEKKLD